MHAGVARTLLSVVLVLAGGCTTLQTTYFRQSYQPLVDPSHPALLPYDGSAESRMIDDMAAATREYYAKGYAMFGYSQFVSPLYTSLAPGYAAKYADSIGAELALLAPPVPGASNLHGFLVTYWARYRPGLYAFGASCQDLPDELLERLGEQYNVVTITTTFHGSPAQDAGLRADDAILAVDGVRVKDAAGLTDAIDRSLGQRITLSVSRQGELLEVPVDVAASTLDVERFAVYQSPWENTAPTDWSSLSAAHIAADVRAQQRRQAELEAAYRQGQLEARQRAQSYGSDERYSGSGSARSRRSARSQPLTREQRARGEYREFERAYNSNDVGEWLERQGPDRGFDLKDWTYNAPATYEYLFRYPAFVQ